MKIKKIIRSWQHVITTGMLSTMRYLNFKQKIALLFGIINGKALYEYKLYGGKLNPDKTFYIIRRDYSRVGLFSMYVTNAGHIRYALENGYIPVIDMCNYNNCYLEKTQHGKKNAWEYFFYQPSNYTIDDVYKSKNVILGSIEATAVRPNDSMDFYNNTEGIADEWHCIAKEYMRVREDILKEADAIYEKLMKGKKVLGVAVRGTDYIALRPKNHPIQPSIDRVITDADEMMKEHKCDCMYLSTEDQNIIYAFKKHFGDLCIVYDRKLISYHGGRIISELNQENPSDRYLSGKDYLITVLLLTKTDVLLSSRASSNIGAKMISDGWDYEFYYDLGLYQ